MRNENCNENYFSNENKNTFKFVNTSILYPENVLAIINFHRFYNAFCDKFKC